MPLYIQSSSLKGLLQSKKRIRVYSEAGRSVRTWVCVIHSWGHRLVLALKIYNTLDANPCVRFLGKATDRFNCYTSRHFGEVDIGPYCLQWHNFWSTGVFPCPEPHPHSMQVVIPEEDAEKRPRHVVEHFFSALVGTLMRSWATSVFVLFPMIPPLYFLRGEKPGGNDKKQELQTVTNWGGSCYLRS